jgi:hypothetical protein
MEHAAGRLAKIATDIINERTATQPYTISSEMARDIAPLFAQDNALSRWLNEMSFARAMRLANGEERIARSERAAVKPVYMAVKDGRYEWLKGIVALYVACRELKDGQHSRGV